MHEEKL